MNNLIKIISSFIFMFCFIVSIVSAAKQWEEVDTKIVSPRNGDTFYPGDKVTVKVTAQENTGAVLITTTTLASTLDTDPPFEFVFTIPNDVSPGSLQIMALYKSIDGQSVGEDETTINIKLQKNIKLTDFKVYPDFEPIHLYPLEGKYAPMPIYVYGIFSDGIRREITFEPGTRYVSSNEAAFRIDFSNPNYVFLVSVAIGEGYLTITNGSISKKIKIIVIPHER